MATETRYPDLKESSGAPPASQTPDLPRNREDEISLLDLLIVLAERKRTILLVTATCAILALIVSFLLPKRYTATVALLPPQQSSSLGAALSSQLGNLGSVAALAGGSLGIKNPNDMYVAMLTGQTVEDGMVHDYELQKEYHARLMSEARKAFEQHATVDGSGKDGLIHISVDDHDPNRAAQLANGYVDEFRDLSKHLAFTEAQQRANFFSQQLEQSKDNLANAEVALQKTEQSTGLIQLDSQAKALIESAASLRAQIAAKEVQIQGMQMYAAGENAQLMQAQQEVESMRAQLAKLGGSEDTANSLIVPKGKLTEAGLEYVRKLRDVKYYETIFDILARQFEIAQLDKAREGAMVQVVDPAVPPDRKSFPKRGLITIIATVVGFFLGVVAAFIQAGWSRLKEDPEAGAKLALFRRALRRKQPSGA
ncbi:MAG: Wzz/FepE/Etk N-terminal domain-containing protein [Acidobacteriaceae bacterium]